MSRARKAAEAANAITVDAETKRKIKALASEHNLKEDEFLSIVIDLLHERRGSVEGFCGSERPPKRQLLLLILACWTVPH